MLATTNLQFVTCSHRGQKRAKKWEQKWEQIGGQAVPGVVNVFNAADSSGAAPTSGVKTLSGPAVGAANGSRFWER